MAITTSSDFKYKYAKHSDNTENAFRKIYFLPSANKYVVNFGSDYAQFDSLVDAVTNRDQLESRIA